MQRLDGGEALGVLVLAGASDDGDVGLRRRHAVDPEEAERVAAMRCLGALEHGGKHDGLAGAVLRAGDVEALRPTDDPRAELVPLGELVVDDRGRAEEEVLERGAGRQVAGVDEGDVLVASVGGVAVVLDDGGGRAAEARDVGRVVAVDEAAGALRKRHRPLDREDVGVGARERELPVGCRARHHAGHDAPRRLRAAEDVVHEERQRVVAGGSCVARRGGTRTRWRHGWVCRGIRRGGQGVSRQGSRSLFVVEETTSECAVRHSKSEHQAQHRPDGLHRVLGHVSQGTKARSVGGEERGLWGLLLLCMSLRYARII
jgi:hypothetical protein